MEKIKDKEELAKKCAFLLEYMEFEKKAIDGGMTDEDKIIKLFEVYMNFNLKNEER